MPPSKVRECTRRTEVRKQGAVMRDEKQVTLLPIRGPYPMPAPLMALSRRFRSCTGTSVLIIIIKQAPIPVCAVRPCVRRLGTANRDSPARWTVHYRPDHHLMMTLCMAEACRQYRPRYYNQTTTTLISSTRTSNSDHNLKAASTNFAAPSYGFFEFATISTAS